ncbi:DUF6192 family protein [Embleya sp. NPDC005575]|uniref:DUF6192 family protein n=1 Tax=Embleya sp. NPDC005575 TaxID=3156892 RepID=UPI0033A9B046
MQSPPDEAIGSWISASERSRRYTKESPSGLGVPAIRKIEHSTKYLDPVGPGHQYVATFSRPSRGCRPRVHRGRTRDRPPLDIEAGAATNWLEAAIDSGEFTLDEQLMRLLKGE